MDIEDSAPNSARTTLALEVREEGIGKRFLISSLYTISEKKAPYSQTFSTEMKPN